jgi:hypothetical protein
MPPTHTKKTKSSAYTSYQNLFIVNAAECARDFELDCQNYRIYEREEYTMNPPKFDNMSKGEERFRQFQWYVENAFWKPHIFQSEYIKLAYQVGLYLFFSLFANDQKKILPETKS